MSAQWNFPEALVEAVAHHHEEKWKVNPVLGRILYNMDQFVRGVMDFDAMVGSFSKAGMRYPVAWKEEELTRVQEMLKGEREKARSLLN